MSVSTSAWTDRCHCTPKRGALPTVLTLLRSSAPRVGGCYSHFAARRRAVTAISGERITISTVGGGKGRSRIRAARLDTEPSCSPDDTDTTNTFSVGARRVRLLAPQGCPTCRPTYGRVQRNSSHWGLMSEATLWQLLCENSWGRTEARTLQHPLLPHARRGLGRKEQHPLPKSNSTVCRRLPRDPFSPE